MTLFTPEPRAPRTYAEHCLDGALGSCHPTLTWDVLRERGATDQELREYIGEFAFGLGKGHWSDGDGDAWRRYECIGGENPRLWAITEAETRSTGGWGPRAPDFQGTALLNTVRELRGIWRPA
ncbi:hypothetical protein ACINK0_11445 [Deinococcus sp. VB343]|uniref:hypothetical protein n=1 Tax=Deinococcus sp. VB343 TaxID=3385567 RepID=UPI0039C9F9E8